MPGTVLHLAVAAVLQSAAVQAEARTVSGTAWQPDRTPMAAFHLATGAWQWMVHGRVAGGYFHEASAKGGSAAGSVNWLMLSATRDLGRSRLTLTLMGSAESLTLGECGYPRLLAAGAACESDGFGEYQHPHAPVMELSARWTAPAGDSAAFQLYVAPIGEPALGPVHYLHRASAGDDPVAPISAHDLNPAHSSMGVMTAALLHPRVRFEVSRFQARTAPADRVPPAPGPLESTAARVSWHPSPAWATQASIARMIVPPGHHANTAGIVHVMTASVSHAHEFTSTTSLATTAAWSRLRDDVGSRQSVLLEGALSLARLHTLFLRFEAAHRFDVRFNIIERPDGSHAHEIAATRHGVAQIGGGAATHLQIRGVRVGAGVRGSIGWIPDPLFQFYRQNVVPGITLFASVTPAYRTTMHVH